MERRNFLKATIGTVGTVGLAGCGEESRSEKIDGMFKAHAWLGAGEGIGAEMNGDEHWRVMVTELDSDGIDIKAEKIVADEVGQNKEGIDPTYTFDRTNIGVGDLAVIENDFRVTVIELKENEAHVGIGESFVDQDDVDEVVQNG